MSNTFLPREKTRQTLQNAFDFAENQVSNLVKKYPADYYPMYTVGGKFGQDQKRWTHWCDGFYPGMMFIFAEQNDDDEWLEKAIQFSTPLEERQYDRAVHDLGFLFLSTYSRWLDLGGPEERIQAVLIQAGKTMAMRFMEKGQYLRSFVEPASLFIDIMMNVGTLFHAGLEAEDQHLLDIANRHCETTRRTLVRGDGSTSHEALFDLNSGECLRQSTHQGYRGDSCWSRGLAWSLYGFTRSYLQSGVGEYLQTAQLNADYYLANTPANGVTPWDYDAPESGPLAKSQVDTSAAAISASGLLDLADATSDPTKARAYRDFALTSLVSLSDEYLGDKTRGFEGILNGGVYHIHKNLGVHEAVLFGEYFYVEALQKALDFLEEEAADAVLKAYPEDSLPASARNWADGPTEEDMAAPTESK
ncbi:MAG: glycoside hydrolase family 88 protein [Armatimonadetes bacterium]|nr:glycoside hydrolase family 88 protein [Armatimonadota bacterium]